VISILRQVTRFGGLCTVILVVGVGCRGAAPSNNRKIVHFEEVRAERITVVGEDGKDIAVLGSVDGEPVVRFMNERGATLARLGISGSSASLSLFADKTQANATLQIQADGTPQFSLQDAKGGLSIVATAFADGQPWVHLRSGESGSITLLGLGGRGVSVTLKDQENRKRIEFVVSPTGSPGASIFDENGEILWSVPPRSKP